ncbi:MAG: hypothetical protein R8F63_19925 [Acidimicrobiales bacterium]|nr:hypothetical protein [Acidimicrobiales bacterium]
MSHIVIHEDTHNVTQYAPFDDVQSAAAYLEELHNADGPTNARLFALEEVQFAVRSYVKVEIDAAGPISEVDPAPVFTDAPAEPVVTAETGERAEDDDWDDDADTVEYVEAAMAPVDAYAPPPVDDLDEAAPGEVRRGLFGR